MLITILTCCLACIILYYNGYCAEESIFVPLTMADFTNGMFLNVNSHDLIIVIDVCYTALHILYYIMRA